MVRCARCAPGQKWSLLAAGWALRPAWVPRRKRHYEYVVIFCGVTALEVAYVGATGDYSWRCFGRSWAGGWIMVLAFWWFDERELFLSSYEKERLGRRLPWKSLRFAAHGKLRWFREVANSTDEARPRFAETIGLPSALTVCAIARGGPKMFCARDG